MTARATNPYRVIQVGTGGMGMGWCRNILPPFAADELNLEPMSTQERRGMLILSRFHQDGKDDRAYLKLLDELTPFRIEFQG